MNISVFWHEFAGVHAVVLAALVCIVLAGRLRRTGRAARFGTACTVAFLGAGLLLAVAWLLFSDPFFWHWQGPVALLFASLACLAVGLASVLVSSVLAFMGRDRRRSVARAVVICLVIPSACAAYFAARHVPDALRHSKLHHVEALGRQGVNAVPEVAAALDDSDPYVVSSACLVLSQLGPAATAAVPALVSYLERTAGSDAASRTFAITALARISPGRSLPVFLESVSRGKTSWADRHAIEEAAEAMGARGVPLRDAIVRYNTKAIEPELQWQTRRLASDDPAEVGRAAEALASMGACAAPALPALQKRLAELDAEHTRPSDNLHRWLPATARIDVAVSTISTAARTHLCLVTPAY